MRRITEGKEENAERYWRKGKNNKESNQGKKWENLLKERKKCGKLLEERKRLNKIVEGKEKNKYEKSKGKEIK